MNNFEMNDIVRWEPDTDYYSQTFPLHVAASAHAVESMQQLLAPFDAMDRVGLVNIQDNEGKTPLHKVAEMNIGPAKKALESPKFLSVQFLCEQGANPNIRDNMNRLPLYYAIKTNRNTQYLSVIALLVNKTVIDVNTVSELIIDNELECGAVGSYDVWDYQKATTFLLAHCVRAKIGNMQTILQNVLNTAFASTQSPEKIDVTLKLILADPDIDLYERNKDGYMLLEQILVRYIFYWYIESHSVFHWNSHNAVEATFSRCQRYIKASVFEKLILKGVDFNQSAFFCESDDESAQLKRIAGLYNVIKDAAKNYLGALSTESPRNRTILSLMQDQNAFIKSMQNAIYPALRAVITAVLQEKAAIQKEIEKAGLNTLNSRHIIHQFSLGSKYERQDILKAKTDIEEFLKQMEIQSQKPEITARLLLSFSKDRRSFLQQLIISPKSQVPALFQLSIPNEIIFNILKESLSGPYKPFLFVSEKLQDSRLPYNEHVELISCSDLEAERQKIIYQTYFPFHVAAEKYSIDLMQSLLASCNDDVGRMHMINAQDREGKTPLHKAIGEGARQPFGVVPIIKWLLENGANPNMSDHNGSTPLCRAIRPSSGYVSENYSRYEEVIVGLLLHYGADCSIGVQSALNAAIEVLRSACKPRFGFSQGSNVSENAENILNLILTGSAVELNTINVNGYTRFDEVLIDYIFKLYQDGFFHPDALSDYDELHPLYIQKVIQALVLCGADLSPYNNNFDVKINELCDAVWSKREVALEELKDNRKAQEAFCQEYGEDIEEDEEIRDIDIDQESLSVIQDKTTFVQKVKKNSENSIYLFLQAQLEAALQSKAIVQQEIRESGLDQLNNAQIIRQFALGSTEAKHALLEKAHVLLEDKETVENTLTIIGLQNEKSEITARFLLSFLKEKNTFLSQLRSFYPKDNEQPRQLTDTEILSIKNSLPGPYKRCLYSDALQEKMRKIEQESFPEKIQPYRAYSFIPR